ncbi:MAG: hypothetical protein BEN19_06235 [Epulopiscium sp. Nuni2H_MBin003]|nr:MAG: hypothetical protein BEN19_06235 [Epulopiscium sp. Nuni2H_MBin003]
MQEFKMYTYLVYPNSLFDYFSDIKITENDFILTNEFLYEKHIKSLNMPAKYILIERYGQGEPTSSMVDNIRKDMPKGITRIFAIGGGSVIDIAKMLSLSIPSEKTEDILLTDVTPTKIYDIYAIPTTCGTGSEVTNAFAVELTSLKTKRGMNSPLLFPKQAVLIPDLILELPYKFFATSSVDALIHASESFLSPKATAMSELFSKEAITLILTHYKKISQTKLEDWTQYASEFLNASAYAGIAFCSAGCAAVHALSYPLGGCYHIPHGEANQLVFEPTFRKYKEKMPIGKINAFEELVSTILEVPLSDALNSLFALLEKIIPRKPLREYGISDNEFIGFAEGIITAQTRLLHNNYTPLTQTDIVEIYNSIY